MVDPVWVVLTVCGALAIPAWINHRNGSLYREVPAKVRILAQSGKTREATELLEQYIQKGKPDLAHFGYGVVWNEIGDYVRSTDSYRLALQFADKHPNPFVFRGDATTQLAMALILSGRHTEALKKTEEARALFATRWYGDTIYTMGALSCCYLGNWEAGHELLDKAMESPQSRAEARCIRSFLLTHQGRLKEAQDQAIMARGEPDKSFLALAYSKEAESLIFLGSWTKVESLLINARESVVMPGELMTRFRKGMVMNQWVTALIDQKRFPEAMKVLDEIEPDLRWHEQMSLNCAAKRLFLMAQFGELDREELTELEARLNNVLSHFKDRGDGVRHHLMTIIMLGDIWREIGEPARGRRLIEQAQESSNANGFGAIFRYKIAQCYEVENDIAQALSLYEAAANWNTEERHRLLAQKRLIELTAR